MDGSETLPQGEAAELACQVLGMLVWMRGDICGDGLHICDMEMDDGCAVDLYSFAFAGHRWTDSEALGLATTSWTQD